MHCPTCREENAPTTRFCTSCGAVLVEEAPEGGRRRVLRPWGLRRNAPPTVSPDFPGARAGASHAADAARGRRTDFWLAGGVVALIAAGTMLYPTLRSEAGAPAPRAPATEPSAAVAVPSPVLVRETTLAGPALVEAAEPLPAPKPATVPTPPAVASAVPLPAPRPARVRGVPAVPADYPVPPRESVISDGRSTDVVAEALPATTSTPSPVPPPIVDRWQPLRDELALCQPLGLFQRAMCEQGARLAHCDGHWGQSDQCPTVRTEYGQ